VGVGKFKRDEERERTKEGEKELGIRKIL